MAIYVNKNNNFEQSEPLLRECPHCGAHAQLVPVATPSFEHIVRTEPRQVGIVFQCGACNEPRFLRATVRAIDDERVELSANLAEIERPRERFQYSYLPEIIELLFRETLDCYTAGVHNAFAMMCRRTVNAALATRDANTKQRWRDTVAEALQSADIDTETARTLDAVLFGERNDTPIIGADEAAVLVEVVKDLFYQAYVRTAKLRAAIKMRRFFADEGARNVTPIERGRRELA